MTCNLETDLKFSFSELCEVARRYGHGDGWGVAWLEDGRFRCEKCGEAIWESDRAGELIGGVRSRLIVVHARKRGSNSPRVARVNSHPFVHRALGLEWVFIHNGQVWCPEPRDRLTSEGVDSERFFLYLLESMEKVDGDEPDIVPETLKRIWSDIRVDTSLNFVLASKNYLYAFRYCVVRPDYYSLYWLRRSWESAAGGKIGKRVGEVALIVSSERLTGESGWSPLRNGEMLIVRVGSPDDRKIRRIICDESCEER